MIKKIILTPKSSFSEMFTSDQIWGQFIWCVSDLLGEAKATAVVEEFRANPPLLFSSIFLDGYLPKPFYINTLGDFSSEIGKHNKKCNWLSFDIFKKLQQDCNAFTSNKLSLESHIHSINEIHASIDRDTLKVKDKGLYNSQYLWTDISLSIYVDFISSDNYWIELVNEVIAVWNKIGLGGDKNVGHGQFDIKLAELSQIEQEIFDYHDSDKFISLANCFGPDLVPISYSVDVYSGIVGRMPNSLSAYRKKPIIRYKTGSLFLSGKGCIANNMGFDSSVSSYGYVFPVYMKYEGEI